MKKIVLSISILFVFFKSFSQDCPVVNDKDVIDKYHVKSVSINFNSISDLEEHDSLEVTRVEFDKNGNITYEKYFRLFDVILYSEEFKYSYNDFGQLIEKIEIQKEYPKTKQDSSLLDITGYDPSTTKWTSEYDKKGNLIKEFEFLNADDEHPTLSSIYEYDKKGNRIKGTFKNIRFPEQTSLSNRIELYEYNKNGQLISERMNWTTSNVSHVVTIKYNEKGNKTFESRIHNDGARGNIRKYKYQEDKLMNIERYKVGEEEWFSKTTFEYSETGCKSKGITKRASGSEWFETFECNDKGLLESEYWYTEEGEKAFSFETEYEYY